VVSPFTEPTTKKGGEAGIEQRKFLERGKSHKKEKRGKNTRKKEGPAKSLNPIRPWIQSMRRHVRSKKKRGDRLGTKKGGGRSSGVKCVLNLGEAPESLQQRRRRKRRKDGKGLQGTTKTRTKIKPDGGKYTIGPEQAGWDWVQKLERSILRLSVPSKDEARGNQGESDVL